jgi:hypothetical protein
VRDVRLQNTPHAMCISVHRPSMPLIARRLNVRRQDPDDDADAMGRYSSGHQ